MSKFLTKLLVTTVAVLVVSYVLSGVHVATVFTAFVVSLVLALLNGVVKPILVILTIPITVVTLGLFLLVINILIVKLADCGLWCLASCFPLSHLYLRCCLVHTKNLTVLNFSYAF